MDTGALLAVLSVIQVCFLAWVAAWQQRAAQNVRALNGAVVAAVNQLAPAVAARPAPAYGFLQGVAEHELVDELVRRRRLETQG